jgi:hypothetical protein
MWFADALSLLDKVLLHEMTHGRMAYLAYLGQKEIEGTDDVRIFQGRTSSSSAGQISLICLLAG